MNNFNKTVLLTGGLGYIGSHIAVELIEKKYNVIIIDNLINSKIEKLDKLKQVIPEEGHNKLKFIKMDMLNSVELDELFKLNKIDIVIHLAGLKSVGESVSKPIYYYENNLVSTLNLVKMMEKYECYNLIFSSSATVYGNLKAPYDEDMNVGQGITNPYGKSKYMQEEILKDLYKSNSSWNIILLRYFNPVSQKDILLREEPNGIPNNLFPYLVRVHNGELPILNIFGNDYETKDGTCIRDFIHVYDLAMGHVAACDKIIDTNDSNYTNNNKIGLKIYNLGTGNGISVKELIEAFEKVNDTKLNYKYVDRREGDLDVSFANCSLAEKELKWKSIKTIDDLVRL
jgi:UDP-glucose 4-epimerase